jgi:hypothetical protein
VPHKSISLWQWLILVFSTPNEGARVFLALLGGELARWLLGGRSKWRYLVGDILVCVLVYYAIRPFIAAIPAIYGQKISPDIVMITISLLGAHGIKTVVVAVARKFGLNLEAASTKSDL